MKAKQEKLWEDLNLKQNWSNLLAGGLIVILGGITVYRFVNNVIIPKSGNSSTVNESLKVAETGEFKNLNKDLLQVLPAKHTIVAGETLWSISEKYYKTGFNWINIAKENKLNNPDAIHAGNEIIIPSVGDLNGDGAVTTESVKTGEYKIVVGDTLWNIAVKLYGDGYKWVELSQANNIINPDVIHVGNVLKYIK